MKKKKNALVISLALLMLLGEASAGVPNFSYSHDYDIGTLTSTPYETSFGAGVNMLLHSYTFDLAAPATVDAFFFNPRYETGNIFTGIPPLTMMVYDINMFDSQDHLLYSGTITEKWDFGSTKLSQVDGVLPAGENYYVRIAGQQLNDSAMAYQLYMVATPVPEPGTYAMFIAGLSLLVWRMRRLALPQPDAKL